MRKIIGTMSRFGLIVILFGVLYSFAMFQGGFVSWFLFFSILPILLYQIGMLFYPIRRWEVKRKLSSSIVQAGNTVSVQIKIKRKIPFPLYYLVCEEIFPKSLNKHDLKIDKYQYLGDPTQLEESRTFKKMLFPLFKRSINMSYKIPHIPRGEHELRSIRIQTKDFFGLIKKEHIYHVKDALIVHPNERSLMMVNHKGSLEHGTVASQAYHLKNSNIASGVREYVPGDKFSWIDWKQTARKSAMMTKEFEHEENTDILLVLNSCYHEGINLLAYEVAIEMILSLIKQVQKQDSQVDFLSIGKRVVHFSLDDSQRQKDKVYQYLTTIQPTKAFPFSVQLKKQLLKVNQHITIIILLTHINQKLKQVIQQLNKRMSHIAIMFIQSSKILSTQEQRMMEQLQSEGVSFTLLTEKELVNTPIEVKII